MIVSEAKIGDVIVIDGRWYEYAGRDVIIGEHIGYDIQQDRLKVELAGGAECSRVPGREDLIVSIVKNVAHRGAAGTALSMLLEEAVNEEWLDADLDGRKPMDTRKIIIDTMKSLRDAMSAVRDELDAMDGVGKYR